MTGLGSRLAVVVGAAVSLALFAGWAHANSIGPNCGSCAGAIYTLSYSGSPILDADPLHETFRITLGIDTNTYTGGGSFLNSVAIKVTSLIYSAALVAAPAGVSFWSLVDGGINSGGCNGNGAGFECAEARSTLNGGNGVVVTTANGVGTDYSFAFDITVNNGDLFTALDEASIKALFVDSSGLKTGSILSEHITLQPVPEPGTLALVGTGLVAIGAWGRKRLLKARHHIRSSPV